MSAPGSSITYLALRLHAAVVLAFLYLPILVLAVFSFNASRQTAVWQGFTTDWYAKLMGNARLLRSLQNSLVVAGVTTVLATVIGTAAAMALARYRFRGRSTSGSLLLLPMVIPEVVLGFAMATAFGVFAWSLGLGSVMAAHLAFSIPYVVLTVRSRLAGLDPALEEAAMDLGAGPWSTFFRVTLPALAPGVIAAALMVFTLSLDDYVITSFVAGPGATTLPLQIYSMVKVGVTPEVNAVSTLLLLFTGGMVILAQRLQRGASGGSHR